MSIKKLLVPVDFTAAADTAIELAALVASKNNMAITLLHIEDDKSASGAVSGLKDLAKKILDKKGISCEFLVIKGSIFKDIARIANPDDYELMIIGTHGFKGIREKFFGSDILKLVKNIPVPVITIQKDFRLSDQGIRTIVFPAGAHKAFAYNVQATIYLSRIFGSEVHLYTMEKPGQEWSEELKANIEMARREFEANQVPFRRISEQQTTFSLGYSKQILKYAKEAGADMIAVMSVPTSENYYFADADKEMLLTNEARIPVLCTSDKKIF